MGNRYLTDLADVLRAAGCTVVELAGWPDRARSSGGYDGGPWAVVWHHTASAGDGAADAPVCNLVIGRDGVVYVCAAGATNTNGKGGPHLLPDGRTIPADGANSRVIGVELSNDGVGMAFPAPMMDAAFAVSLACAAAYDIDPTNVVTHQVWAPSRKIDPATADAVEGDWWPTAVTSSGTWSLEALRDECWRRAGAGPDPTPLPPWEDDMQHVAADGRGPMLLGAGWRYWARNDHEGAVMAQLYGDPVMVSAAEYDLAAAIHTAPSDGAP